MNASPSSLVERFTRLDVLVIGDAMLDVYLEGSSGRLCPEGPVPVVDVDRRTDLPGGAANTAANVAALGARASLLSVCGDDPEADTLARALGAAGVGCDDLLRERGRRTLARQRVVSDGQLLVRFDHGTLAGSGAVVGSILPSRLRALFERSDAVIVSDYGYGVMGGRVVEALGALQARSPRVVVVDAKDLSSYRRVAATAVKPNYRQVVSLLGRDPGPEAGRVQEVAAAAERLLDATGAQIVAVTLDRDGAVVAERGRPLHRTFASTAPPARAAGAGDTFVCAFTLALAAGAHTPAAAELASAAAATVVGKQRTAVCSAAELRAALCMASHKCVADRSAVAARVAALRVRDRRVVFTNGCFDLLHRGHITYLNRAKALGDVLVVGVNSDLGVERLKGPGRPINKLEDRMEVLAALSSVDLVVPFDEDTPERLIETIRPDVFVKGGDYTLEMLPEAPVVEAHGGVVHIVDYVTDTSTTGIVERIRASGSARAAR